MRTSFILAAAAWAAACTPAFAGTFTLTPGSSIQAGSSFDVAFNLGNAFAGFTGDSITSVGFDVGVRDSSIILYTGFTPGALFFDGTFGGGPDVLLFANDPSGVTPASTGYSDPFQIAVLHFNALRAGTTTVDITTDSANDPNEGLYFSPPGISDPLPAAVDFSPSGGVTVVAATPEPGTIAMVGLGLVGMAGLRRRSGWRARAAR